MALYITTNIGIVSGRRIVDYLHGSRRHALQLFLLEVSSLHISVIEVVATACAAV